jgi:hypothetical protein
MCKCNLEGNIDWVQFQTHINENICLNIRLKEKQKLKEATEFITKLIQEVSMISTPAIKHQVPESHNILWNWSMKNAVLDADGKILETCKIKHI